MHADPTASSSAAPVFALTTLAPPPAENLVLTMTPLGYVFREDATPEELITFGQSICSSRAYLKFALGSVFLALIHAMSRTASPVERERAQTEAEDYARAFAVAHGIDPKEFREILGVARFYQPADLSQCGGLSFEHMREAMWGAAQKHPGGGALPAAVSYLTLARAKGWRYTELRRYIRSRDATPPAPRQLELAQYGAVFDFMRFCKRELQEVHAYTPERAAIILTDLGESTFLFLDALRALAGLPAAAPSRYSDSDSSRG